MKLFLGLLMIFVNKIVDHSKFLYGLVGVLSLDLGSFMKLSSLAVLLRGELGLTTLRILKMILRNLNHFVVFMKPQLRKARFATLVRLS